MAGRTTLFEDPDERLAVETDPVLIVSSPAPVQPAKAVAPTNRPRRESFCVNAFMTKPHMSARPPPVAPSVNRHGKGAVTRPPLE
ncbi:MAG: hypothetical protein AAFO61_13960, partial [Pseudomonadota bacterium]